MISFHWYGFFIGLGILGALQVSLNFAKTRGIKKELVEKMAWWAIIGGIVGARIYHVVHLWSSVYKLNPLSVLYVWNGGLGIWGAILGGTVGLILFVKFHKPTPGVGFLKLLDVMVMGVPLGQAVGRLGNWTNGELYGKNGEPLFAWEAGLNLLLLVVLWNIGKARCRPQPKAGKLLKVRNPLSLKLQSAEGYELPFAGKITGGYLIGYGIIRIFLEYFRPEEIVWKWQGIPMAVIMSIISLLVGGFLLKKKQS